MSDVGPNTLSIFRKSIDKDSKHSHAFIVFGASVKEEQKSNFDEFWSRNDYIQGSYDKEEDFARLRDKIISMFGPSVCTVFYLAVPPNIFSKIFNNLSKFFTHDPESNQYCRVIVEKPFGHDLASSEVLSRELSQNFSEDQIYRIDHYLGKEMVQNLLMLRFGNVFFEPLWSTNHIDNIMITFKESFGTQGRGGYFDSYGIIRDVIQNHLIQILSLVAMEKPVSKSADDIREEKVRVLRMIEPIKLENVVLGQYVGNPNAEKTSEEFLGYTDDKTVPKDSTTETYACMVLKVKNDRWKNVPFILRAGKALSCRKAEVRIQFKPVSVNIFDDTLYRNEIVIRVQPNEAVYMKMMTKSPGMSYKPSVTELDLTYSKRFRNVTLPDAYEKLVIDVFAGNQTNFVRTDELQYSWKLFDPILKEIKEKKIKPIPYVYGSRNGPKEADELIKKAGFVYNEDSYEYPFAE